MVSADYVDIFLARMTPLLDDAAAVAANATFQSTLLFDERRPHDPTRTHGVKPNCARCDGDGHFTDYTTGLRSPVFDRRFDAVQTLRLLGYMLHTAGYACPELYDDLDPFAPAYGPDYRDEVCGKDQP
jgi:hypothetical protein